MDNLKNQALRLGGKAFAVAADIFGETVKLGGQSVRAAVVEGEWLPAAMLGGVEMQNELHVRVLKADYPGRPRLGLQLDRGGIVYRVTRVTGMPCDPCWVIVVGLPMQQS